MMRQIARWCFAGSVILACQAPAWSQAGGERWPNLFGTDEESEYVAPYEIGDTPPPEKKVSERWQWSWRPRSWEWKQPAFLQRMSDNTARSWRNTRRGVSNWMTQTGSAIRESTYDTWETITRGPGSWRVGQGKSDDEPKPITNGRVHEFLSRPRVKF